MAESNATSAAQQLKRLRQYAPQKLERLRQLQETKASLPQPGALVTPIGNGLTLHANALPAEADSAARLAFVRSTLTAITAMNSGYWNDPTTGAPICVVSAEYNPLCRISPEADGKIHPISTDAGIVLLSNESPTYRPYVWEWQPDKDGKPFSYAAVRAAEPPFGSQKYTNHQHYQDCIASKAAELDAAMSSWLDANDVRSITDTLLAHAGLSAT